MTALGDKNVCRFDVTVNDPLRVRGVKRVCDFDGERKHGIQVQHWPRDPVLQSHSLQILHRDKRLAVLLPNFIDRADIRMIQCRSGLGLTLETGQSLGISS